jgi:nitroimidazol reductase NimA-like FMN-containing flavoprotein (pyridoxamine 5'-phosphate oxidase superfamily)
MPENMEKLLRTHDMCVLATAADGRPHCSLMAYVCDDAGRHVYMATYRKSVKFLNLLRNPAVSLLIDTRETHGPQRRSETKALTATGQYEPPRDPAEADAIKTRLLASHPQLEAFLQNDDVVIITVKLNSFLLLNGLTDAVFREI